MEFASRVLPHARGDGAEAAGPPRRAARAVGAVLRRAHAHPGQPGDAVPIITAKEVASIDHLSGGRFEFGIGAGWNREEMRNHGTDPRVRMAVLHERIEAMRTIWRDDEATYHGRHVSFERIWSYPKPAQRPHPPILVGGTGPGVLDRVLSFGTAWFPTYDASIFPRIEELRARAESPIDVQVLGTPADPAVLQRLHEAGVQRASRWLSSAGQSTVERDLDRWEQAIAEFTGEAG